MKILKSCAIILLAAALCQAFDSVAGKWACSATTPDGNKIGVTLDLKQGEGGAVSGDAMLETGDKLPIAEGKVDGNALTFKIFLGSDPYTFEVKIDGNKLSGKYSGAQGSGPIDGEKKAS